MFAKGRGPYMLWPANIVLQECAGPSKFSRSRFNASDVTSCIKPQQQPPVMVPVAQNIMGYVVAAMLYTVHSWPHLQHIVR